MNIWKYVRAQWDRTTGGALFALGALALVLGWVGVSKQALTALQIPYIVSGGLGGIFLLGLGAVFWLSADMRDEWRKLDALEQAVDRRDPVPVAAPDEDWLDEPSTPVAAPDVILAVEVARTANGVSPTGPSRATRCRDRDGRPPGRRFAVAPPPGRGAGGCERFRVDPAVHRVAGQCSRGFVG